MSCSVTLSLLPRDMVSQQVPTILLSPLVTALGLQTYTWPYPAFCMGTGIQTQIPMFVQQAVLPTEPSFPAPFVSLKTHI